MYKKISTYALVSLACLSYTRHLSAQTRGYVQQDVIKTSGVVTEDQILGLSISQKQTTMSYYDGLGRTLQTIGVQASPLQNDLIQPTAYDNLGRQTMGYLPYAGKSTDVDGSYRPNAISADQPAFYNNTSQYVVATDHTPYTQQVMESSPLQRRLQWGMAGDGFQPGVTGNHYKTITYRSNTSADGNILVWNPDGTFTTGTYYAISSLSVSDGTDEDGEEILTFTDISGHMILKRQIHTGGNYDTYYIYNAAGLVSYIVPPLATVKLAPGYNLTATPLSNLVFKYVYDAMGRVIEKTTPSQGKLSIVYDPLSRPVLMQDANMLTTNKWNYIKYDIQGRVVSQGIYTDVTAGHIGRAGMQAYVNTLSTAYNTLWYESPSSILTNNGYYTSSVFPTVSTGTVSPLAYAYYDDYDINQDGTADFAYSSQGLPNEETATSAPLKGMPTIVSKTTVGSGLTNTWLTTVTFYDKRGNAIQSKSNNQVYYTGATTLTDIKTIVPDFTGTPLITKVSKQTGASVTTTVQTNITYDHTYRVTGISQQYNGGAAIQTASYNYNELGQVIVKNLGILGGATNPATINLNSAYPGTNTFIASSKITLSNGFSVPSGSTFKALITANYLQSVDFRYNIRGQLTNINNSKLSNDGGVTNADDMDLFGMQLLYDLPDPGLVNTPWFSGRLAAVKWMSKDDNGTKSYERAYKYNYDDVNRYTDAIYAERPTLGTAAFVTTHGWDERVGGYDENSNILRLTRNSSSPGAGTAGEIDNLTYTYSTTSPNQLQNVTDGTDAAHTGAGFRNLTASTANYTYDGTNGNLTADPYKGITLISYNLLNLTDRITLSATQYIDYTYDGSGSLLRKQAYKSGVPTQVTDYIDGFVYNNASGVEALTYFPMPEGRVRNDGGTLHQEFVITDQQGNARISFQDNGSGKAVVRQENSYYSFGMIMPNSPVGTLGDDNKKLYNGGSEWQNDFGNLPDYYQTSFRNYDAAIGRFIGVDPMAESAESMTSYQYAGNNPVMMNDPMGNMAGGHPYPKIQQGGDRVGSLMGNYGTFDNIYNPTDDLWVQNADAEWENSDQYQANHGDIGAISRLYGGVQTIYHAYDNGKSTGISKSSISSTLSDYAKNGVSDVVAGTVGLAEVNIKDAGWKIQAESYQTSFYANQGGLTHAQELAKYGQISWGYNFFAGASVGSVGGTVEIGTIITDKGWARNYKTIYYAPGFASPSASHSFFFVNSTSGKNLPVFSDWNGLGKGVSGSFDFVALGAGLSSNYSIWSLGVSFAPESLNFMKESRGSGGLNVGNTTWIGPAYMLPGDGATQRYQNTMKFQGGY